MVFAAFNQGVSGVLDWHENEDAAIRAFKKFAHERHQFSKETCTCQIERGAEMRYNPDTGKVEA